VGNSWRTGRDLFAVWDRAAAASLGLPGYLQSVMEAVDGQRGLARFAGPGGFNDPDMLTVGLHGM
jgi:alpha-galactosidase